MGAYNGHRSKALITLGLATVGLIAPQAAGANEAMAAFLQKHYGWMLELKQERKLFGFSWDITCPGKNPPLPEAGKKISRSWVCRQEDSYFWTVISWRLPSVKPETVQQAVYRSIGSGLTHGTASCRREEVMHEGLPLGFIEDCDVPLHAVVHYVSFLHFEATIPDEYEISVPGTFDVKKSNRLGFTIWVQSNKYPPDPAVRDKLRELVKAIRFTAKP